MTEIYDEHEIIPGGLHFPEGMHFEIECKLTDLQFIRLRFWLRDGVVLERPYISIA